MHVAKLTLAAALGGACLWVLQSPSGTAALARTQGFAGQDSANALTTTSAQASPPAKAAGPVAPTSAPATGPSDLGPSTAVDGGAPRPAPHGFVGGIRHLRRELDRLLTSDEVRSEFQRSHGIGALLGDKKLNPRQLRLDAAARAELTSLLAPIHRDLVDAELTAKAVVTEALMLATNRRAFVTVPQFGKLDLRELVHKHFGQVPALEFNAHVVPGDAWGEARLVTLPKADYPEYHAANLVVDTIRARRDRVARAWLAQR